MSLQLLVAAGHRNRELIVNAVRVIGMAVAYFVAAYAGLRIDVASGAASVWPASGLLLGVLLLTPVRFTRSILIGTLVGGVAANLSAGFGAATSLAYTCINLGEGLAGRWLVRRYFPDAPRLSDPVNAIGLMAAGSVAAIGGASIAALVATYTGQADTLSVLVIWAGADIAGVLTVAPVILATADAVGDREERLPDAGLVEAIVLYVALIAVSVWLFLRPHPSPLDQFTNPLVFLPLVAWAAIRFEVVGAAWAIFIVNMFSVWGASLGLGPSFEFGPAPLTTLIVQARIGVTGIVALSLGAAVGAARRSAAIHKRLAFELQSAADAERTRLSHELHDEVAQRLAALKMQLQLADLASDEERPKTLAPFVPIVDGLLSYVRQISHSLRPAPFDRGQLVPALAAMARTEGQRGGLCVLIDSPTAELSLPREIELICYRVVREAVSNVVKHARARNVAVSLSRRLDSLVVSIVDDGRGFDVAPTTRQAVRDGHLGLVGMRERLSRVGGTLTVTSTPGAGTTVVCLVPLGVVV
jgi:signal transduction histidine kinase